MRRENLIGKYAERRDRLRRLLFELAEDSAGELDWLWLGGGRRR
jgi:hypothetical protein